VGTCAEAGEQEHDEPPGPRLAGEIVGGQVERLRDAPPPLHRPGPVLAEQGPLVRELARVTVGEPQAVRRREQQGRGIRSAEEPAERRLGGLLCDDGLERSGRQPLGDVGCQRGNQVVGAQARRLVIGIANSEEGRLSPATLTLGSD
jgi:hypothetical protein